MIITDGSIDFSGGIDSVKVPTVQSESNPNGLPRNKLAWMTNCAVRDGGINSRNGWIRKGRIHAGTALYQGGFMYSPDAAFPYIICLIGGELFNVDPDFASGPVNLTSSFAGTINPATADQAYFCQGENFLVIQAGDGVTLPLFWDGTTLRRSIGITNTTAAPGTPGVNELPAAYAMDYYQGRLWYAQGKQYSAGDIVGGQAGTVPNNYRDAILNVTECPLVLGGDGFTVPSNAGNIRAIFHNANINAVLGEGQLMVGTRKAIYALDVPVSRNNWIASTTNNAPRQTLVQLINGPVNDRSIVKVNGDVFYQTLDPAIASLAASVRNSGQWGSRNLSANEYRLLRFNDRSLMRYATGIEFSNRMLQGVLPRATAQGVVHQAMIPLDFIPISSFGVESPPVWEGMYEGLDILQMFTGDFGGRERAFAITVSRDDSGIDLWELTDYATEDENIHGDLRVTRIMEFPAYTWGQEFLLKKMVSAELWLDRIAGTIELTVEWRPDSDPCWKTWHKWTLCSAKNSCEDPINPICYPITAKCEGYRATLTLPQPPLNCASLTGRPAHIGYQMQLKLTIKGWCRVRGIRVHAEQFEKKLYQNMVGQ